MSDLNAVSDSNLNALGTSEFLAFCQCFLVYFLTCGGFGIFYLFDLASILLGNYYITRVEYDNPENKYQKTKTRLYLDKIDTPIFCLIVALAGIVISYIYAFFNSKKDKLSDYRMMTYKKMGVENEPVKKKEKKGKGKSKVKDQVEDQADDQENSEVE